MNKIWWVPLEIIDNRYTKLTRIWFEEKFKEYNLDYEILEGEYLTSKIENGSFLDCYGTIYYKSSQIKLISELFRSKKIKNNDIFFIDDIWMPGVEAIKYMANMTGLNIKLYGIYHAGSHTPSDDVAVKIGRDNWVKSFERSLLELFDGVFVGSNFHKNQISEYHNFDFKNIINTGLAFNTKYVRLNRNCDWKNKEDIVIFPHRLHAEKKVFLFDQISEKCSKIKPNIKFIKTQELNLTKDEFYDILAKSKIMFSASLQENFGYSALESAALNCKLLLPNRVVYPEFYPKECIYQDNEENAEYLVDKIIIMIDEDNNIKYDILDKVDNSIDNIINEILKKEQN